MVRSGLPVTRPCSECGEGSASPFTGLCRGCALEYAALEDDE